MANRVPPGEVRLTPATRRIIEAIRDGHTYGLAIIAETGGAMSAVYPTLRRLEAAGWATRATEDPAAAAAEGRPPRTLYTLTDKAYDRMGWV